MRFSLKKLQNKTRQKGKWKRNGKSMLQYLKAITNLFTKHWKKRFYGKTAGNTGFQTYSLLETPTLL